MAGNPKLEKMGFDHNTSSNCEAGELEENDQKISVSDHVNGVQHWNMSSDSFVMDMERFSHVMEKDINEISSRITRNLSRNKGSVRGGEKKISPATTNQRNASVLSATSRGGSTPEKPVVVAALGATDHSGSPKLHHQITIKNISLSSPAAENPPGGKRFGFRRSPPSWSIDPRRILMFFATLSSMGTILLIYFTLSMGKLNGEDDRLN